MTKQQRAKSHHQIYILVAVDVRHTPARRARRNERIDHLFPCLIEPCVGAVVCQYVAIILSKLLRTLCAFIETRDQLIDVFALARSETFAVFLY